MIEAFLAMVVVGVIGFASIALICSLILLPLKLLLGAFEIGLWLIVGIPLAAIGLVLAAVFVPLVLLLLAGLLIVALPVWIIYAVCF